MKLFVVRLNPDTRECISYSKYPTTKEYKEIHSQSPMDGFHEAVNFLPENGTIRGYLPPRHSRSLRNGIPFCLITITAKTAKIGGDKIIGIQAGCIYNKDGNQHERINLSNNDINSPNLTYHYSCQEALSLLFLNHISNARNIILGNDLKWIRGPVKEINKESLRRILKEIYSSKPSILETKKLKDIESLIKNNLSEETYIFADESDFLDEVKKHFEDTEEPCGNEHPQLRVTKMFQYVREPAVVAYAMKKAKGKCGDCNQKAPFTSKSTGLPYLEVHHKIPLKDGGSDTADNVIALCPNCHRKKHFG